MRKPGVPSGRAPGTGAGPVGRRAARHAEPRACLRRRARRALRLKDAGKQPRWASSPPHEVGKIVEDDSPAVRRRRQVVIRHACGGIIVRGSSAAPAGSWHSAGTKQHAPAPSPTHPRRAPCSGCSAAASCSAACANAPWTSGRATPDHSCLTCGARSVARMWFLSSSAVSTQVVSSLSRPAGGGDQGSRGGWLAPIPYGCTKSASSS